jgi:hypothetical protein
VPKPYLFCFSFFCIAYFVVIQRDYQEITKSLHFQRPFIDPEWSLEQIIGRLGGFKADEIDPF